MGHANRQCSFPDIPGKYTLCLHNPVLLFYSLQLATPITFNYNGPHIIYVIILTETSTGCTVKNIMFLAKCLFKFKTARQKVNIDNA